MIWDRGTWEPESPDVNKALAKGDLKMRLHGKKMKGSWVLVRMRDRQWLLIKHRDQYASATQDLTLAKPKSVVSRRSMAGIARAAGASARQLLLDGEVVVFDPEGISRFQLFGADTRRKPVYVVFDCLYARGRDLRGRPLAERRAVLEKEVRPGGPLRLARRLGSDGFKAFEAARERGLEGIVAKDEASTYETGKRSPAWRKVKVRAEEEFVIGGYTAPEGARTHFGALLIGAFDDGTLRYAGKGGTGFTSKMLADLEQRFAPLRRATSPFADAPRMRDATWLEPRLVAQIGFMEKTGDGKLRHPTFLGLRDDKSPAEVRWTV